MELHNRILFDLEPLPSKEVEHIEEPVKVAYKAGSYVGSAQILYNFMLERAEETTDKDLVYKGTMRPLALQMGISPSYLHALMRLLFAEGCIRMLAKGAGGRPSKYLLVRPLEDVVIEAEYANKLTGRTLQEVREQQIRQLMRETQELRDRVAALEKAKNG